MSFNVLSLNIATLVFGNSFCHWRSAFKNNLAFDYHMIIRMVIILKWNPSQPKVIENYQVCSGKYILFAFICIFFGTPFVKVIALNTFLYYSELTNCIWLHFQLIGFFTWHKLAVLVLERYGALPSYFRNKSNLN